MPSCPDDGAPLFNLACYRNRRAELVAAKLQNNSDPAVQQLRELALDNLRQSNLLDDENGRMATTDEDLASLDKSSLNLQT